MIRRIFVEKKKGFDVEAQSVFSDIKQNLHIEGLNGVRVINRYDISGISDETYEKARYTIFAEPTVDVAYDENFPFSAELQIEEGQQDGQDEHFRYFGVEFLQGQYDQRADSAVQCIKMIDARAECTVKCAKIMIFLGKITDEDFNAIKKYSINPVDSQEASEEKPESLELQAQVPEDVKTIEGFEAFTESQLEKLRIDLGLAMTTADLMCVKKYFQEEKRNPTMTEIKVIDTYWSDHCRHTTFMTKLTDVDFEEACNYTDVVKAAFLEYLKMREEVYGDKIKEKNVCLMDLACIGTKYLKKQGKILDLDESEEINACSIKVKAKVNGKDEDWVIMFKNETHNHPTEIEPFGGAATCLGGAIRDPLSGRSYVYQAMRVTGAGDPTVSVDKTLQGKLPQRKLVQGAAAGYSSYGNQIGLATGKVEEIYDENFVAKRMEVGAVIGAAPADHIRREVPKEGDIIVLLGGKTGRDGCGGATGSSKGHTEESILTCGAEVQKGNPPVEKNLQRMFRRKEAAQIIKRCNDFGAGGVSVAIGELADSIDVNLDLVPKKYNGLDGTELAISESQERMAVVIDPKDEVAFKKIADEENLEATVVAKVTDTGYFRMFWREKCILNLSREFLNTNGATQEAKVLVKDAKGIFIAENEKTRVPEDYLSDLNCCSQKGLVERFDSTIGAGTVLMPLGGKYQLSPTTGMAAKLPVTHGDTETATIMAFGYDPLLAKKSPFFGAMYAVIDSVTKLVAMGGDYSKTRLTFQEYFEKMTDDPTTWGKPFSALLGALRVQKELGIPAIGGKDSMSGTFKDISVPPTLISFAVAVMESKNVISTEFKKCGSKLVYLPAYRYANGTINFEEYKNNMVKVRQLALEGKILAANTIGKGGLFISLMKMAVGNKIGAEVQALSHAEVYGESYGSLILEVEATSDIEKMFIGTTGRLIGTTADTGKLHMQVILDEKIEAVDVKIENAISKWTAPLESIFPVRTADFKDKKDPMKVEKISFNERNNQTPIIKIAKPRVLIPVFPGTNCEVDSRKAFEKAGAEVDVHIIRNLTSTMLTESIMEMEEKIKKSQIIMIPGGFSGGDEPDGSAKFITAIFRNPRIAEAVTELMDNRDGLMLGICNGFQALIKLGLVPYGRITVGKPDDPTLTYNKIGRHASCLVRTRVASVKSPWMAEVNIGDVHTVPISHGEGRFIADEKMLKMLIENGQVATQYVDYDGNPSMDIEFNPNYSVMAIEGITSPDGRIFGKMAHSERIGENIYKNVEGNKDQKIFESGVKYFK